MTVATVTHAFGSDDRAIKPGPFGPDTVYLRGSTLRINLDFPLVRRQRWPGRRDGVPVYCSFLSLGLREHLVPNVRSMPTGEPGWLTKSPHRFGWHPAGDQRCPESTHNSSAEGIKGVLLGSN